MIQDAALRRVFQEYSTNVSAFKQEHGVKCKSNYRMSRKEFLDLQYELPGVLKPQGSVIDETCCIGAQITVNEVDIIFNSVCSHEVTINFLQFCKALVALSMKLYPRSDASLSFALFLSEILYALPFVPVNTRARAHARAAELLATHTLHHESQRKSRLGLLSESGAS